MRFRLRRLALAGAAGAVLLGAVPVPAVADAAGGAVPAVAGAAGPVVLLGTGGLRWTDVGPATPVLQERLTADAAGWLAVRSVRSITCPVDGWLAVSAGRRAADEPVTKVGPDGPSCREAQQVAAGSGAAGNVPRWSDYLAAARAASFDAAPGLLGQTLSGAGVSSAAVGPGAAIALADADGQVGRVWPGRVDGAAGPVAASGLVADVRAALATEPGLLVVDLGTIRDPARRADGEPAPAGTYARPRVQQVAALEARLGPVLAALPAGATVIIASLADSGAPSQLQLVAAEGPGYSDALLGSRSTRQDGLVQSTDLLPTLLTALSVPVPAGAVGSPVTAVRSGLAPDRRRQDLADLDEPSAALVPLGPWVTNVLVITQLLLYGGATLVLRGRARALGTGPGRPALRRLRVGGVFLGSFPAASYLANTVPWWRADPAVLALAGAVLLFMVIIAAVALLGPWRAAALGPATVVATVTATVLAVDALTGSRLLLSSLMGVQPVVAGRFYGFSNTAFAFFATAALLVTIAVAGELVRRGHRARAVGAVVVLGIVTTAIDGTPGVGSDFGGPPALIPAFAVLALLVAGVRVTWRRMLLIAGLTVAVLAALSLLDWLRAPGDRTHLGRFVQSVLDGEAGPVLQRKGAQNVKILFTSYLSAMLPFAAAFVYYTLGKPVAAGVRPLRAAVERVPVLREGLIAVVVMMVIAALLNDSGTAVPAYATMLILPLLIATCARAVEPGAAAGARDPAAPREPAVGRAG